MEGSALKLYETAQKQVCIHILIYVLRKQPILMTPMSAAVQLAITPSECDLAGRNSSQLVCVRSGNVSDLFKNILKFFSIPFIITLSPVSAGV